MFFLDVRPEEADRRIRQTRDRFEMFENLEELEKTRRKALSLAQIGKWRIINASKSTRDVENEITSALEPLFY
jgi:thymidylate kinase